MIELDTGKNEMNPHEKTIILLDQSERTNCITVMKIRHRGETLMTFVTHSVFQSTDNRV